MLKEKIVYKIFRVVDDRLTPPYDWHGRGRGGYKPGKWHTAENPVKGDYEPAFHAYIRKDAALTELRSLHYFYKNCVVRRVKFRGLIEQESGIQTAKQMFIPKSGVLCV